MTISKRRVGIETILASTGIVLFAWFIGADWPLVLLAMVSLCLPAWMIVRNVNQPSDILQILGIPFERKNWQYLVIGILSGVFLSLVYRWYLNISLLPNRITAFAIIAAFIGASEELFFRGYLQGRLKALHPLLSIILPSIAHTTYKACLFLSPYADDRIDIQFLVMYTFGVGLLLGGLKHKTGSVVPALVAHALFDICVYGQCITAPWWVW